MKRLALIGLFVSATIATASIAGKREELRPYANLNVSSEATTAATGGLGAVALDRVKSTVQVLISGGAPCGPGSKDDRPRSDPAPEARPDDAGDENGIWLPVGIGAGACVAGVGFLVLRRSKV